MSPDLERAIAYIERRAVISWLHRRSDTYANIYADLPWWRPLGRMIAKRTAGTFRAAAFCIDEGAHAASGLGAESAAIRRAILRNRDSAVGDSRDAQPQPESSHDL